jgi:hypothetical protein
MRLSDRGQLFNKYALGSHHLQYKGNMSILTEFGTHFWKADGRIMIDCNNFNQNNPGYPEFINFYSTSMNETNIDPEQYFRTMYVTQFF